MSKVLRAIFLCMGFHDRWVDWIMWCVTSVSYTMLLNGKAYGNILSARRLRQGDPLSPFLFILCVEALIHVMKRSEMEGRINGIRLTPSCPAVPHFLFVDDSLIMCRATISDCEEILRCLTLYGDASGQLTNFQKSVVTFDSALEQHTKTSIKALRGINQEDKTGKYLGLPECFSGSKQEMLSFIGDRLHKRLQGWYAKTLSLGGKEVLSKSIAMALPIYAISCFRLSKNQCKKVTSAMIQIWWKSVEGKRKIPWVSWNKLCRSKQNGGMGFKDMEDFNQALLAKQSWRVLSNPGSLLSQIYKGRYFARMNFLECGEGCRPSYTWKSIIHGRELLKKGLMHGIGDGKETFVWIDKQPRRPCSKEVLMNIDLKVSDIMDNNGTWIESLLQDIVPPDEIVRIKEIFPTVSKRDFWMWPFTISSAYYVKSGVA